MNDPKNKRQMINIDLEANRALDNVRRNIPRSKALKSVFRWLEKEPVEVRMQALGMIDQPTD